MNPVVVFELAQQLYAGWKSLVKSLDEQVSDADLEMSSRDDLVKRWKASGMLPSDYEPPK